MKVQPITLGELQIKNNVFLAPIAGYTDYAFRHLSLKLGVGLCFTELVSAKGIVYKGKGNAELLRCDNDEQSTAVQIFGNDPYFMRSACESQELEKYNIVDINMGCPVPKINKNGEGSALLKDIRLAESVVKECVKSGKVITVKIRIGQKKGDDIAKEFCQMLEQAGAKLVTIHGRVRESYYSGDVDYNAIRKAKQAVKIPIIANGGIFTVEDADRMVNETGADGIMLARGAIANPFLASEILGLNKQKDLKKFILEHLELRRLTVKDSRAAVEFRKFVPYYFKGMPNVKDLKLKLFSSNSIEEMQDLIEKYL